jgi:hypothetical protein
VIEKEKCLIGELLVGNKKVPAAVCQAQDKVEIRVPDLCLLQNLAHSYVLLARRSVH